MRFQWKVSADSGDGLDFEVDGWPQQWLMGQQNWQSVTYVITTAGTHTLKWRYSKDSSGASGSDCGWVKAVTWQPTPSLAQAVNSTLVYTSGGDAQWYANPVPLVYYSDWQAYSGDLDAGQSNWMQTTVTGGGVFSFWWKPVMDASDTLEFSVDGTVRDSTSGSGDCWSNRPLRRRKGAALGRPMRSARARRA